MKHVKRILLALLVLTLSMPIHAATEKVKRYSINGKIRDKSNGEALFGATIYVSELKTGASSDVYGNYSLTLQEGSYTLVFSYIGYLAQEKKISLDQGMSLTIELQPKQENLKL